MLSARSRRRSWSTAGDDSPVDAHGAGSSPPEWEYVPGGLGRRARRCHVARPVGTPRPCARRTGRSCDRSATASTRPDAARGRDITALADERAQRATTRTRSSRSRTRSRSRPVGPTSCRCSTGAGESGSMRCSAARCCPPASSSSTTAETCRSCVSSGVPSSPTVQFHDDDACLERTYDLVFASSSLQYSEQWARCVDRSRARRPVGTCTSRRCRSSSSARRSSCASEPSSTGSTPST